MPSWLVPWHAHPVDRPTLLCLPAAGSGCGQFRAWQAHCGGALSVVGVQLPGRETRWADPWPSGLGEVVDAVVDELVELVPAGHPLVLFGHSFGALLGYEVTKRLESVWRRPPRALVVAACRPPHMWVGAGLGLLEDVAELNRLFAARQLDDYDLDDDTREVMLEVLRRDAGLTLGYANPGRPAVGCPMEVWSAAADAYALPGDLRGWRDYAAGRWRERMFPGDHYTWLAQPDRALTLLTRLAGDPACTST